MSKQGFVETIKADIADGTQILNGSAEALIMPDINFAADDPRIYPGAAFRYTCYFDSSFVITTPGTLILRLRWGGIAGTILAQTGAYAPDPTAALANRSGKVVIDFDWRTVGPTGSCYAMGEWSINDVDDASATTLQANLALRLFGSAGANTPAVVGSLDTTTAKALSLTAQHSVATATTQTTGHIRRLECLN